MSDPNPAGSMKVIQKKKKKMPIFQGPTSSRAETTIKISEVKRISTS